MNQIESLIKLIDTKPDVAKHLIKEKFDILNARIKVKDDFINIITELMEKDK